MIVYNGKKLDASSKDERFSLIYRDGVKFLRNQKKKYFTFSFPENQIKVDEEGNIHTPAGSFVKFRQRYMTEKDGTFDVIYYNTSFFDKNGNEQFRPRHFDFRGTVTLNIDTHEDLIWFLLFVSPHVEVPDWFPRNGYNINRFRSQVYYRLENKMRDAEKEYDLMADVAHAQMLIYNPSLGLSKKQLEVIARSYNIKVDEDTSDKAVRAELGKKVLVVGKDGKYNRAVVSEFLSMAPKSKDEDVSDNVNVVAVVNDLIDLGMIYSEQAGQKYAWKSTEGGNVIMKYHPNDDGKQALASYLSKEPSVRIGFESRIKEKREAVASESES